MFSKFSDCKFTFSAYENVIENENFWLARNYTRYEKNLEDKIIHLKKIKSMRGTKKMLRKKLFISKRSKNLLLTILIKTSL